MQINPKKPRTVKQQYWLNHLQAANNAGVSLSQYAKTHKLKLKALYNWRWTFRQHGLIKTSNQQRFVQVIKKKSVEDAVCLVPTTHNIRVIFANKNQIEITLAPNELTKLLAQVSAL